MDTNRSILLAILTLIAEAFLLALMVGIAIGVLGYLRKWDSSLAYSDAFFIAGSLAIVAGALSRFAASQERNSFQLISAEGFRGMSASERANLIIDVSSSFRHVILGLLTGMFLFLLSVLAARLF
ncbi:MAG: hypothetical protein ACK2UW_04090 [Anaerolineales bacterium]